AGDDAGEVFVEVAGTDAGTRARAQTVADLLGAGAEELGEPPTWFARYPWANSGVALKLTCQLSGVADVVDAARSVDVPVDIRGSAGVGVLFAAMSAATDPRDVRRVVERLRAVCGARGGSVVVVDAPAQVKEAVDVWGP